MSRDLKQIDQTSKSESECYKPEMDPSARGPVHFKLGCLPGDPDYPEQRSFTGLPLILHFLY